jgi:hypothetical protein
MHSWLRKGRQPCRMGTKGASALPYGHERGVSLPEWLRRGRQRTWLACKGASALPDGFDMGVCHLGCLEEHVGRGA